MTYDIRGIVAEKRYLDQFAAADPRLRIVELDHPPFALLPLAELASAASFEKWGIDIANGDPYELLAPDVLRHLMESISQSLPGASFAFVESHLSGGSGSTQGFVVGQGPPQYFNSDPDCWSDTNISKALRQIGVPERNGKRQDAFDVVGLGRFRSTKEWLATP